ncbi:AGE family epimerase/isomerase [Marinicellulosiphila megalodicopiae]|uniref:AGE family epimerase/isomerase n=1 Tax=Marinicellulosiphila megalodicopiae TaxID=2724896 RepID=UPI003BB0D0E0
MNFFDKEFLTTHIQSILDFYEPNVIDVNGGYAQNFYDDGSVFNVDQKQLVSSTRLIVNYALSAQLFDNIHYRQNALHGLKFLEESHFLEDENKFVWTFKDGKPNDLTQQAYGYAFVLLAYSQLKKTNIIQSDEWIDKTFNMLETTFWQEEFGLYADELSEDNVLSDYRGQNSNMHLCEAMIAAYEATQNPKYLARAKILAFNIAIKQADLSNGLVWEHFNTQFKIDWEYNKNDPKNLYRPWGFQPGHQTEWTKLLLQLYQYDPQEWMLERAKTLFDTAWNVAWDHNNGGLFYGFDTDKNICDDDKYFWVQAESFAAAALLYKATNDEKYLERYNKLWQYSWDHFVDHENGAWYRVLKADNSKYSNKKSEAGAKCDYHTICACLEVLKML